MITGIASPVLDNVTIIMLVAPVTLVICDRLDIAVQPFLIAEVLASNIGGAATLIGDPPNIIIGSRAGLTFNDFLVNMAPAVLVIFNPVRALHQGAVPKRPAVQQHQPRPGDGAAGTPRHHGQPAADPADRRTRARDRRLHPAPVLHFAPSIIALVGAGLMLTVSKADIGTVVLEDVEWPTLVFFSGLFVMVAGLTHTGIIFRHRRLGRSARTGDNYFVAATVLLFGSSVIGAFIDNIPYATTTAPVVEGMVAQAPDSDPGLGVVVGVRARRRLRRQRHRDRGQRQRRRHRHRLPLRTPDHVLAVHPLRHHRHRC